MAADTSRFAGSYDGTTEPCAVVLFGASGDLAKRKVIPAMFDLAVHQFARTPLRRCRFRAHAHER